MDYFTTTAPWPRTTGARLRVSALYEALLRHHIDVRLIVVGERPDPATRRRIEGVGGLVYPHGSDALLAKTIRYLQGALVGRDPVAGEFFDAAGLDGFGQLVAARRPDAVLVGNVFLAPLIPKLRGMLPGMGIILDNHNVESLLHERMAALGGSLRVRWPAAVVARTARRLEHRYTSLADQVWACSKVDAGYFSDTYRLLRVHTIPNAIDTDEFARSTEGEDGAIVFTGTLWHPPNDQAAHRLVEMSGRLRAQRVRHTLYIVGQGPKAGLLRAARKNPNVVTTGTVPDIRAYIARAALVAAPLEVGSGTKLKLLQAMSMGKAIVTTRIGAEGLELSHGVNAVIADSDEFEAQVIRLLQDPGECGRLGAAARSHVVEHFSLEALRRELGHALHEVLPALPLAG